MQYLLTFSVVAHCDGRRRHRELQSEHEEQVEQICECAIDKTLIDSHLVITTDENV